MVVFFLKKSMPVNLFQAHSWIRKDSKPMMGKKKTSLMIGGLLVGILAGVLCSVGWAEGNSANEENPPAGTFDTFKVIPNDGPSFY
jgi:hypothetical protein